MAYMETESHGLNISLFVSVIKSGIWNKRASELGDTKFDEGFTQQLLDAALGPTNKSPDVKPLEIFDSGDTNPKCVSKFYLFYSCCICYCIVLYVVYIIWNLSAM